MKITEADLRRIIEEELKTIANSKHPSDVEMIEDPNVGGILVDPFEHIPEDVPAVVDKPQARVQNLVPIVRERRYSLRALLEQNMPIKDKWAEIMSYWIAGKDPSGIKLPVSIRPVGSQANRNETHELMATHFGDPAGDILKLSAGDLQDKVNDIFLTADHQDRKIGYDDQAFQDYFINIAQYRNDFNEPMAVGSRDPEGTVEFDVEEINEARFVGGFGFGAPPSPTLSEVEDLDECGCDNVDMPSPHLRSAHDDHEGSMARSQLRQAAKYSQKLGHMINESDNLPEWVEAKITKASDYLGAVYNYLDYEINGK